MTKIYFVRHSKVKLTIDDATRPLSEEGELLLVDLLNYFKTTHIDFIVSSPYDRAVNTIKPIALEKQLEIETIYDLRERKVSHCFIDDFETFVRKQWDDFNYKLESGESLKEVQERAIQALEEVIKNYKNKTIVVGTHGTFLSTILNYYNPSFGFQEWISIKSPDIYLFEFKDLNLVSFNNINYKK